MSTQPRQEALQDRLNFVILLHPKHNPILRKGLVRLQKWASPRKILIITTPDNLDFYPPNSTSQTEACPVEIIDENRVIPGITHAKIAAFLKDRGADPARAGWYFQQFLKMGAATRPDIGPCYVVWDADTVLLRPLTFLDQDKRLLITASTEYHHPYFETLERLLGLPRLTNQSFISEHMIIETNVMLALLEAIAQRHPAAGHWTRAILENIAPEHLSRSGFSEYETYGNYLLHQKPGSLRLRKITSLRHGALFYGPSPWEADLLLLGMKYTRVTFETWHPPHPLRLLACRTLSLIFFPVTFLSDRLREQRRKSAAS
jgi:hypothetical protein